MNLIKLKLSPPIKRSNNGQPFNLYIEVLLVTDKTIYNDHRVYANTNDQNLVFLHMRSYFSHYMNGVNERYSNALSADPDIRLNIILTNFLILTVSVKQKNLYSYLLYF